MKQKCIVFDASKKRIINGFKEYLWIYNFSDKQRFILKCITNLIQEGNKLIVITVEE